MFQEKNVVYKKKQKKKKLLKEQQRAKNDDTDNENDNENSDDDDEESSIDEEELEYSMMAKFEKYVNNRFPNEMSWEEEDGSLVISHSIWKKYLLDPIINPIISHISKDLLLNDKVNDPNNEFKRLCLAGGFSNSIYFQARMQQEFGQNNENNCNQFNLSIHLPRNPTLCVVQGAVRLGLRPDYVQRRFLSKTYGIAVDREITSIMKRKDKYPNGFIERNKYVHKFTKRICVKNLFSVYVRKGDSIGIHDKPIQKKYRRFSHHEPKIQIQIYCSDLYDPYVVTDDYYLEKKEEIRKEQEKNGNGNGNGKDSYKLYESIERTKLLGTAIVEFPPQCDALEFPVNFYFGQTQIRVTAEIDGNVTQVPVDYAK